MTKNSLRTRKGAGPTSSPAAIRCAQKKPVGRAPRLLMGSRNPRARIALRLNRFAFESAQAARPTGLMLNIELSLDFRVIKPAEHRGLDAGYFAFRRAPVSTLSNNES